MSLSALHNFIRTWRQQPALQVSTLSVLIGSFTILAIAMLVHQNLEHALTQWGREVRVNVYLNESNDDSRNAEIKQQIENSGFFSKVDYLTKADAMAKFKSRVNEFAPDLLADLEADNPLPASFEMTIEGGMRKHSQYQRLVEWATKMKAAVGVDEVSYGQGWIENYASVLKVFSVTSLIFIFVILSGSLFVIGNSIRSAISQRRDEIEILELFGATRGMILWPYVFEGLLLGLMASVLSVFVTYILFIWQTDLMTHELSFWNFQAHIDFLSFGRMVLIVFTGTTLGGLGSYLWARKVCTGWAAAESASRWEGAS